MDASDVPPEATAIRLLKAQMAERTRELTSLLEISRDISSNLSIDSVLEEILDKLKTVVPFTNATIVRREGDMFFNVADHKLAGASPVRDIRFPASNLIDNRVMAARKPFIIQDVQHDETEEARDFRRQAADVLSTYYKDVRSWMRVPMIVKGEVVGMLTLHHDRPDFYTQHHADLALAFAENASVAMENARLFETLERRTTELASLLNVARTVTSTLDLGSLLTIVLDQLHLVVEYDLATIRIIEGDDLVLAAVHGKHLPSLGTRYKWSHFETTRAILAAGRPQFVPDLKADTPLARVVRNDLEIQNLQNIHSWMGVPLMVRNQAIGLLSLAHHRAGFYNGSRVDLVNTFALQAAVAIENARLYDRTRELAALEERQRLARELHDSVSQALYGIALGARTASIFLERDPTKAVEPLEYVASLAEAGLTEMRALIFELHPESLQMEGLAAALAKQAEVLRTRHKIAVEVELCPEPDVPLKVKEALYRVAQEAMHNVVKHARATRVGLRLFEESGALALIVFDDGQGFETGREFPGHLGLRSMRERVEQLGGEFLLSSSPGDGTTVRVRINSNSQ